MESERGYSVPPVERKVIKPQLFEYKGRKMQYVEFGKNSPEGELPVLIVPGWSEGLLDFARIGQALAQQGKGQGKETQVLVVDPPAVGPVTHKDDRFRQYATIHIKKAEAVLAFLKENNIQRARVVAHSQAAFYMSLAALMELEDAQKEKREPMIADLVLISPVGMRGKDGFFPITDRWIRSLSAARKKGRLEPLHGTMRYIGHHPLVAVEEVIANTHKHTKIEEVWRQVKEAGIGVAGIIGAYDRLFEPRKVLGIDQKGNLLEDRDGLVSSENLDGLYVLNTDHFPYYNYTKPENQNHPTELAAVIGHALNGLQQLREQQRAA